MEQKAITVFLCGDVMTGRGIDQALPYPGDPTLFESCSRDARDYVQLAEKAHGVFQLPIAFKYVWGDVLAELSLAGTDVRIINLETSITRSNDNWPDKGIHYRMNPANIGILTAARIDACGLANNHVLDWGEAGLVETLDSLDSVGIEHAGAGRNNDEATAPAIVTCPEKGRVLLFAFGSTTSGIFPEWTAMPDSPGVYLLEDLSEATAVRIAGEMRQIKKTGDVAIASIHWGPNWGYEVPRDQIRFAHRLIEEGFDAIHGHSSHHIKAIEIFEHRPILYGCGDFINDYEGIAGYEAFRGDLGLMYFLQFDSQTAQCLSLRLVPIQARRFSLQRASAEDAQWICALLNEHGNPSGAWLRLNDDNSIELQGHF